MLHRWDRKKKKWRNNNQWKNDFVFEWLELSQPPAVTHGTQTRTPRRLEQLSLFGGGLFLLRSMSSPSCCHTLTSNTHTHTRGYKRHFEIDIFFILNSNYFSKQQRAWFLLSFSLHDFGWQQLTKGSQLVRTSLIGHPVSRDVLLQLRGYYNNTRNEMISLCVWLTSSSENWSNSSASRGKWHTKAIGVVRF